MKEIVKKLYPDNNEFLSSIPSEDDNSLTKLEDALFTTDNCAAASKVRRLAEEDPNSNSQPCWDHFRNTWVHNVEEETNVYLRADLRNSLDKCNDKLCVKLLFSAICQAFDKGFSLTCNYPKDFGENFIVYMIQHRPTFPLYHVGTSFYWDRYWERAQQRVPTKQRMILVQSGQDRREGLQISKDKTII